MASYIYKRSEWPNFYWQSEKLLSKLAEVRHLQGRILGRMANLGFEWKDEASLNTLTLDVLKTSEIEGEFLDLQQVRSSIARRLGLNVSGLVPADRYVDGVVEMMLDATQNYELNLTKERLFSWHGALFPTGRSGMYSVRVGDWRQDETGRMQVVSGGFGKERVHFQAPKAEVLEAEMTAFLNWFNHTNDIDSVLKAAIAHFWFVTIHPFDDGNGRIARAIADMQLARSDKSAQRFYSMSAQIRQDRNAYYKILEYSQKGDLDITDWLMWFLECLDKALLQTEILLVDILVKAKFWDKHRTSTLNERQRKMLNKLLDDFKGKLTTSKWAKMTKCSSDTALRDIRDLIQKGILQQDEGGGRSTSYSLVLAA